MANVVPKGGVISGTSSVVQLDAWNWEDAAVCNRQWHSFQYAFIACQDEVAGADLVALTLVPQQPLEILSKEHWKRLNQ